MRLAILGLIVAAVATAAFGAEERSALKFTLQGKPVGFIQIKERRLLLSEDCFKKPGRIQCQAYDSLAKASLEGATRAELAGGADPGAVVCAKLGGRVLTGTDAQGNENSFCKFKDGSFASAGTLHYHAITKKE